MREEKLSKILSNFQARVRGYLMRGKYGKLQDQRSATEQNPSIFIVQMRACTSAVAKRL